jgi:hypothetical protein
MASLLATLTEVPFNQDLRNGKFTRFYTVGEHEVYKNENYQFFISAASSTISLFFFLKIV